MLEMATANILVSLSLSLGGPQFDQLGLGDEECIIIQDDWTGALPLEDWCPATGESILVDDHVRELAHDVARLADALSGFGVDPQADRIAEAFMRRTTPASVPKRILTRR